MLLLLLLLTLMLAPSGWSYMRPVMPATGCCCQVTCLQTSRVCSSQCWVLQGSLHICQRIIHSRTFTWVPDDLPSTCLLRSRPSL